MGRAGIVILPEFLAKPGRKNRSNGREVLGADLNGSEWGVATTSRLPPDHSTPWCLKIAALRDFDPANDRSGSIAAQSVKPDGAVCPLLIRLRRHFCSGVNDVRGHKVTFRAAMQMYTLERRTN
jgi:hypothetical protein